MNMSTVEIETGRYVKRFAFWNPATWSIPKLYWDAWSQEQRLHAICRQLEKVIAYADYLGVNVDDIAARLKAIEDGQLDEIIVAAVEDWFEEHAEDITLKITNLENVLPIEDYSAENTVSDRFDAMDDTIDGIETRLETRLETVENNTKTINVPIDVKSSIDREGRKAFFLVEIDRSFFDIDLMNNDGTYNDGVDHTDVYEFMKNYGVPHDVSIAFNCDYYPSKMILNGVIIGSEDRENVLSYVAINRQTGEVKIFPLGTQFTAILSEGFDSCFGASAIFKKDGIETNPIPFIGYYAPRNVMGWNDEKIWFLISHGRNYQGFGLEGPDIAAIFNEYTTAENIVNLDGGGSVQCVANFNGSPFMITQYTDAETTVRNVPLNINFKMKEVE